MCPPSSPSVLYPPGFSPISIPSGSATSIVGAIPEFKPGPFSGGPLQVFSVFVDGIPRGKGTSWLFNAFSSFGKILDTYIPGHLSRSSKMIYGFVRFAVKADAVAAINGMNGYQVGNSQLKACEAIYSKSQFSGRRTQYRAAPSISLKVNAGIIGGGGNMTSFGSKSFAQVVSGAPHVQGLYSMPGAPREVCGTEAHLEWLQCSAVATANGLDSLEAISANLLVCLNGLQNISKWGGRSLILQFQSVDHLEEALSGNAWSPALSSLKRWSGELVNPVRLAWISCRRLPLSFWNMPTFISIAGLWGSLVAVDKDTLNFRDLSKARLLVETELWEVGGSFELSAGGIKFPVAVKDEGGGEDIDSWPASNIQLAGTSHGSHGEAFGNSAVKASPILGNESDRTIQAQSIKHSGLDLVQGTLPCTVQCMEKEKDAADVPTEDFSNCHLNVNLNGLSLSSSPKDHSSAASSSQIATVTPVLTSDDASSGSDDIFGLDALIKKSCANLVVPSGDDPPAIDRISPKPSPKAVRSVVSKNIVPKCPKGNSSLSYGGSIKAGFFKKSLKSNTKSTRSEKKPEKGRQCKEPEFRTPSITEEIAEEIACTRELSKIIGVSFDGVPDEHIRDMILQEKGWGN